MWRRIRYIVLKGILQSLKGDICLWCPAEDGKLEESLLFDIDTMISKVEYFKEV